MSILRSLRGGREQDSKDDLRYCQGNLVNIWEEALTSMPEKTSFQGILLLSSTRGKTRSNTKVYNGLWRQKQSRAAQRWIPPSGDSVAAWLRKLQQQGSVYLREGQGEEEAGTAAGAGARPTGEPCCHAPAAESGRFIQEQQVPVRS